MYLMPLRNPKGVIFAGELTLLTIVQTARSLEN